MQLLHGRYGSACRCTHLGSSGGRWLAAQYQGSGDLQRELQPATAGQGAGPWLLVHHCSWLVIDRLRGIAGGLRGVAGGLLRGVAGGLRRRVAHGRRIWRHSIQRLPAALALRSIRNLESVSCRSRGGSVGVGAGKGSARWCSSWRAVLASHFGEGGCVTDSWSLKVGLKMPGGGGGTLRVESWNAVEEPPASWQGAA